MKEIWKKSETATKVGILFTLTAIVVTIGLLSLGNWSPDVEDRIASWGKLVLFMPSFFLIPRKLLRIRK